MDKGLGNKSYRSLNMPQKLAVARWVEAHPSECTHMTYDDLAKLISNEVSFEVSKSSAETISLAIHGPKKKKPSASKEADDKILYIIKANSKTLAGIESNLKTIMAQLVDIECQINKESQVQI
jgi:hypothetical protein